MWLLGRLCVQMPIGDQQRRVAIQKASEFIDLNGGRTRDRTLDLSRVNHDPQSIANQTKP
jgi:hypothetical protein